MWTAAEISCGSRRGRVWVVLRSHRAHTGVVMMMMTRLHRHFADALGGRVCEAGVPQPLLQGVLDVSERMLDSLPEWRRALGRRVMNEVTRLVVVSWGRACAPQRASNDPVPPLVPPLVPLRKLV